MQQYCRLSQYTRKNWKSCETRQSPVMTTDKTASTSPRVNSQWDGGSLLMRSCLQNFLPTHKPTAHKQLDEAKVQETIFKQGLEKKQANAQKSEISVAQKKRFTNAASSSPRIIVNKPPAQPLKLHLYNSFQPLPLPPSVSRMLQPNQIQETEISKTQLQTLIELQVRMAVMFIRSGDSRRGTVL